MNIDSEIEKINKNKHMVQVIKNMRILYMRENIIFDYRKESEVSQIDHSYESLTFNEIRRWFPFINWMSLFDHISAPFYKHLSEFLSKHIKCRELKKEVDFANHRIVIFCENHKDMFNMDL